MLSAKHRYAFFLSFGRWHILSEREKRGLCTCRGVGGVGREGRETDWKREEDVSGRKHIYSKSNLLSQSSSVFFLLLPRRRKKYDAGRGLLLSLSLGQPSCRHTLLRHHFSSAVVCTMLVEGMAMVLSDEQWIRQMMPALVYGPFSSEPAGVSGWHAQGEDTQTTSSSPFSKRHLYVRTAGVCGQLLKELWGVLVMAAVLSAQPLCFQDSTYTHLSRANTLLLLVNSLKPMCEARGRWILGLVFVSYDFCFICLFCKTLFRMRVWRGISA